MEQYLLSIDQGTTTSRCIVFTVTGEVVAISQEPIEQHFPQPGWVEHDPENIWQTTLHCLQEVVAKAGIAPQQIANVLEALQPVPGRMQCLRSEDGVLVVIDYAHTEDALTKVLDSLRPVCSGQLFCVFGCGGERDRGKRPLMGRAAAAGADRLFVTSDNPRSEAPQDIIDDICAGISDLSGVEAEVDRERAILAAITGAQPGDVVLIAGKGHEQSQDIGGQQLPFSDLAVAHRAIGRREAI